MTYIFLSLIFLVALTVLCLFEINYDKKACTVDNQKIIDAVSDETEETQELVYEVYREISASKVSMYLYNRLVNKEVTVVYLEHLVSLIYQVYGREDTNPYSEKLVKFKFKSYLNNKAELPQQYASSFWNIFKKSCDIYLDQNFTKSKDASVIIIPELTSAFEDALRLYKLTNNPSSV